jgi:hypothetical protein
MTLSQFQDFSMEDSALWKPTSLYLHYANCPNAARNQTGSDTEYAEEGEYDYDADDYTDGGEDAYDDDEEEERVVPDETMQENPSNSYCLIL